MWTESPDRIEIRHALKRAGLSLRLDQIRIAPRDERWLVRLPERRVAWFPASPLGERQLSIEGRVLRLIRSRCSFEVPEIAFVDPSGQYEIRSLVGADVEVSRLLLELDTTPQLAREIGTRLGEMLAEQHARIRHADVRGWLPRAVSWPRPAARVLAALGTVIPHRTLLRRWAAEIFARQAALSLGPGDHALAHTDIGFHNLAFAEDSRRAIGVFDYNSAAWADRHLDFRYLLFDGDRVDLIQSAIGAYETESRYTLSRQRILLYNATCAFSYLANRVATRPGEKPCGRTLDEDVGWCEWAAENVLTTRGERLLD